MFSPAERFFGETDKGKEVVDMAVWKCAKCGHTVEGRCRPAKCPKCGAGKEALQKAETK